ncbi:hypothetical protein BHE74_00032238 [Ensete ventricosum]|nr:hypothetical protein GW17_00041197 [Ensete ventricosum]RWW60748.1 hypothetical protein BHE74_00032238 [Ensete ventricosum]RZR99642.1 hypothetical protein BHM03_00029218 [Ensete ventricosum]
MLVLLYGGGLVSNSDCAPSLEHASQRALVTEEWYSPDHKLSGFLIKEFASIFDLSRARAGLAAFGLKRRHLGINCGANSEKADKNLGWEEEQSGLGAERYDLAEELGVKRGIWERLRMGITEEWVRFEDGK